MCPAMASEAAVSFGASIWPWCMPNAGGRRVRPFVRGAGPAKAVCKRLEPSLKRLNIRKKQKIVLKMK